MIAISCKYFQNLLLTKLNSPVILCNFFLGDKEELEKLPFATTGVVVGTDEQVFSDSIIKEQTQMTQQQKIINSVSKSNFQYYDNKLQGDPGIFNNQFPSRSASTDSVMVIGLK